MPAPLPTAAGPVRGEATPPPSKSITHRVLVAAALCRGRTRVVRPLDAEDTSLTAAALETLGARVRRDTGVWTVTGFADGCPSPAGGEARLHLGNSGTSLRLLLPLAALGRTAVVLDGVPRLRQRPVGPQAAALQRLGARLQFEATPGCPPVRIQGPLQGGRVDLEASASSQFLSGLLLAAPRAAGPVEVRVSGLASAPYVDLSVATLERFGVGVARPDAHRWRVEPCEPVSPGECRVEGDASAAAILLAAGAVTGGRVRVRGVGPGSRQGDVAFLGLLARLGCRTSSGPEWMQVSGRPTRGLEADLNATPDLVPPLAAVALFAPAPVCITGIGHLRLKESDRIAALATETAKLGARVEAGEDRLVFRPAPLSPAPVSAHGDHRIAMSLAVAALSLPGTTLDDPDCVGKSYPGFFDDLRALLAG